MKTINKKTAEAAHGKLASVLEKIGLGSRWAKIIAAVLIAGVIAAFGLTVAGCSGSVTYEHPEYGRVVIHRGK